MHIPKDLLYTKEHAWVKVDDDIALIGITEELHDILELIDGIDLPRKGDELYIGDHCASIHYGGKLYDLPCPLTGRVTKVNTNLRHELGLLHYSPYDNGWIFEMEMDDIEELELLMDSSDYQRELEEL